PSLAEGGRAHGFLNVPEPTYPSAHPQSSVSNIWPPFPGEPSTQMDWMQTARQGMGTTACGCDRSARDRPRERDDRTTDTRRIAPRARFRENAANVVPSASGA